MNALNVKRYLNNSAAKSSERFKIAFNLKSIQSSNTFKHVIFLHVTSQVKPRNLHIKMKFVYGWYSWKILNRTCCTIRSPEKNWWYVIGLRNWNLIHFPYSKKNASASRTSSNISSTSWKIRTGAAFRITRDHPRASADLAKRRMATKQGQTSVSDTTEKETTLTRQSPIFQGLS